jgi:hypothetical protein
LNFEPFKDKNKFVTIVIAFDNLEAETNAKELFLLPKVLCFLFSSGKRFGEVGLAEGNPGS